MKALHLFRSALLAAGLALLSVPVARADVWQIASPDHEQTFAYGSEQSRAWAERGSDRHLILFLNFTNDPFVDNQNPRQYDNFTFSFPNVILGKDGHTFYYRTHGGQSAPIAVKRSGFLGIPEIKLLPNVSLIIDKPHGYLSLFLQIESGRETASSN